MTLEELVKSAAAEIGATTEGATGGGINVSRGKRTFAFVSGNVAELKLDPEIADAALGTPATSASTRGPDWIRLEPSTPDAHDLDRAKAWFLSAWRNAAK